MNKKRYVDFTPTGIHVDIDRYLDTPEGQEALEAVDQAGKRLRKKVSKPHVIWHRYKYDDRCFGFGWLFHQDWRVWGRFSKLSDAEHTLEKVRRAHGSFMELKLETDLPTASTETPNSD